MNTFISKNYNLDNYHRSNQDTCMLHRPCVREGEWVQAGDLLADSSASHKGDLALGKNILIAYMPWEGYNYEDAILVSERLVYDDLYTSIHIEKYDIQVRETKYGKEEITKEIPNIDYREGLANLDRHGIVKIGSWVKEGDILVGKITPIPKKLSSPYQKLLYTILEKKVLPFRDTSLRVAKGMAAKVIDVKILRFSSPIKTVRFPEKGLPVAVPKMNAKSVGLKSIVLARAPGNQNKIKLSNATFGLEKKTLMSQKGFAFPILVNNLA